MKVVLAVNTFAERLGSSGFQVPEENGRKAHLTRHHSKRGQKHGNAAAGDHRGSLRTAGASENSHRVGGTGVGTGGGRVTERPKNSLHQPGIEEAGNNAALGEEMPAAAGRRNNVLSNLFEFHDINKSGFVDRMDLSEGLIKVRFSSGHE
jgi:hypothetical protein